MDVPGLGVLPPPGVLAPDPFLWKVLIVCANEWNLWLERPDLTCTDAGRPDSVTRRYMNSAFDLSVAAVLALTSFLSTWVTRRWSRLLVAVLLKL